MPITITQALDFIMALVLVMFIPIGLWRGALREWLTCAGIVFGILLADAAGTRWGDGFAHLFNMDPQLAGFTVATSFFLAATLLIGYGGGVTLPYRPDLSWTNRGLGALLGLGNGFLILSGLLRLMQERLFDSRSNSPLRTADLAAFLLDPSIAWVYLGLFVALLLCVLLGLARHLNEGSPLLEEYSPIYQVTPQGDWAHAARWQPQAALPETGAAEAPPSGTPAGQQETAVIKILPTADPEGEPPPPSTAPAAPNISTQGRPNLRPITLDKSENGKAERTLQLVPEKKTGGDGPTRIPRPTPAAAPTVQEGKTAPAPQAKRCGVCGAPLAGNARFCMSCGHVVGPAERRQLTR